MTNKELQEQLKNYPDDWEVKVAIGYINDDIPITEVASWGTDDFYVWLGIDENL